MKSLKMMLLIVLGLMCYCTWAFDFQCDSRLEDNDRYLHCLNHLNSYPRPVHFFYPKYLDLNRSILLNIHFHGHSTEGIDQFYRTNIPGEGYGDYGAFLSQSDVNAVVVIPESIGKCTTYDQFFSTSKNGFKFFEEIKDKNNFYFSKISFSGHSGAYRTLNKVFGYKNLEKEIGLEVAGVGLLDATYSSMLPIENFAKAKEERNEKFIFFDAYVSGTSGTTNKISEELKNKYNGNENFIFLPILSTNESVLTQHLRILKKPGIEFFLRSLK